MRREASLAFGNFPRQFNKKPDTPRCVEPATAEEQVSGVSAVSVVSAALLISTVSEI